jgi:predicted alpha/beta hydrolase
MESYQNIDISCTDQYRLAGRFYPTKIKNTSKLPILIAPATGITTQFYHSFAEWLAEQGFDVLSFDFRGIGKSLHGSIKNSNANIIQWGQLDLPAAIETLLQLTHANKIILIGHSAGGQLTGIIPNYPKIAKIISVSGSSGHTKGLKGRTRFLGPIMFKGVFPLARYTLGYGPTKIIGMGENLPKDVAKQWAEFCAKPGYIMNAFDKELNINQDFHKQITQEITSIYATDDEIATQQNVNDLLRLYPNAQIKIIALNPIDHEYSHIGHMLMFKRSHQKLWHIIQHELTA